MIDPEYLRDRIVSTKWMPVIPRPNKPAIRDIDQDGWRAAMRCIERPQLSFSPTPRYESMLEDPITVQFVGGSRDGEWRKVRKISPTYLVPRNRASEYMASGCIPASTAMLVETYHAKKIVRRWAIRHRNRFTLRTIFIGWVYVHEGFKSPAAPTEVRWTEAGSWIEPNGFNGGAA
jgi:hypothetical protein